MKLTKFGSLLIPLFILSCFSIMCQKPLILPLVNAYKKQEPISTKEFIKSFTYVPLETSPQCLIGANPKFMITDKYVIITDQGNHCLLFDKSTGKFIQSIGHYGKDPGGYRTTNRAFLKENNTTIYFLGWKNELIKYSLDGKALGNVPIPNFNESFTDAFIPDNYTSLPNNLIACNIVNTNGIQKKLLMIFDETGKEVRSIPNWNLQKEHKFSLSIGDVSFYKYNDKILYNEIFNDTIFSLLPDKVVPYMILDRGKLRLKVGTRNSQDVERILHRGFLESEKYICFDFWGIKNKTYFALYNKSTSKLKVCEFNAGIKNDTDGFVPFLPKVNYGEELVGLVQASELVSWFENNKANQDSLPTVIKKLSSYKITDNPILIIGKL